MKIADFFVQITAKGDLKELKMIADAQKAIKEQSKIAAADAKVKVAELKKETEAIKTQTKLEVEKFKITKQEPLIKAKTLNEELKAKIQKIKLNKEEAKVEAKKPKNLKDMLASAIGLNKAFVGIAGSVLLAAIALDKMVTKLAQANQLYTNFQRQTGMPMGRAIGVSGAMANLDVTMTPQEIMQNMQNLQQGIAAAKLGQGNYAPYQLANVEPSFDTEQTFENLRKALRRQTPMYRTYLLNQLGLDPRLGALIDLSDTEYLKYKQEALELYLSPADRKTIQELAPEWNKVNLKFIKGWEKFTMMLSRDFIGLGKILADLWLTLVDVLSVINTVLKPIFDMLTLILRPIYLLLDDFIGFLIGKDSVIGRFLSGDKEGTKGAMGALFGVGSKELERLTESIENLNKFLENSILGKTIKGINYMLNPTSFVIDLMKNKIIPNVFNHSDRNLSINLDTKVYANNASEGISIGNATSSAIYNMLVPQFRAGVY